MEYQPMPQMNMGMNMGMGMGMGHSNFQPMYQGQIQQQGGVTRQMDRAEQEKMEAAFEQALEDARAQTRTETTADTKPTEPEVLAEETRETKGDLDAVWESLKPEAERLNKLAEWERDFSQVSQITIIRRRANVSSRTMKTTYLKLLMILCIEMTDKMTSTINLI